MANPNAVLGSRQSADIQAQIDEKANAADAPATVRGTALTGLSTATAAPVTADDTVLVAVGKLQAQLDDKLDVDDYIGGNLDEEKLNSLRVVEDFLHSSPANLTFSGFQVLDFSDAQLSAIAGAGSWKGGKLLRYYSGGATAHDLQTHGATSIAGSTPYVMQWNTGDTFQMQCIFALPYLSSGSKQYSFGVGFAHVALSNPESPSLGGGYANAYLYTNTSTGNWHAYSSVAASTQDTNTGIAVVALTSVIAAVVVRGDGIVEFYLDGVVVANHSGSGRITNATQMNPCLSWFNIGEQGVSTDARNLYIDLFAYKLDFASRNLSWL